MSVRYMLAHATQGQFVAVGGQARAEEGPLSMRAALMYSATGVRRAEMYLFGLGARALELEAQRRLVAVLVDVRDVEPAAGFDARAGVEIELEDGAVTDRKSTRLNSSHQIISYAVFCLKKKKIKDRVVLSLIITDAWNA